MTHDGCLNSRTSCTKSLPAGLFLLRGAARVQSPKQNDRWRNRWSQTGSGVSFLIWVQTPLREQRLKWRTSLIPRKRYMDVFQVYFDHTHFSSSNEIDGITCDCSRCRINFWIFSDFNWISIQVGPKSKNRDGATRKCRNKTTFILDSWKPNALIPHSVNW